MASPYALDEATHEKRYERIASKYLACEAQKSPRAIIIGGQPGSGKGGLTATAEREFDGSGGVVVVDVDQLRDRHPDHARLMRENDKQAADFTHDDASKWAKRLANDAIAGRHNLIIDQTSKSPETLIARAMQLHEAGYHVELRVMAVNAEVSEQRIYTRYEKEKAEYGAGRFVPKSVHDEAYVGVAQSVAAVEREKAFDAVSIYDKNLVQIHKNTLRDGEWVKQPPGAQAALNAERSRARTPEDYQELADAYTKLATMLAQRNARPDEREVIEAKRAKFMREAAVASRKADVSDNTDEVSLSPMPAIGSIKIVVQNGSRQIDQVVPGVGADGTAGWQTQQVLSENGLARGVYPLYDVADASKKVHPQQFGGQVLHVDTHNVYQFGPNDGKNTATIVKHDRKIFDQALDGKEPTVGKSYEVTYARGVGKVKGELSQAESEQIQNRKTRKI
ncbi:zeta toxin family protein [Pseudomonas sp. AK106]|jgi:predicted ABC-type ATPase